VLTRDEGNTIYRLMAIEKWGVFLLSLIVMAIASLTIVGVLVMVIIDKREERTTLLTLGATPSLVRRVFTSQGMMMVWRSMVGGVVVGVVLTLLQQHFGLVRIGAASLMVDAYPVELQWGDVVAVAVGYYAVASIIVRLTVRAMER
jgi:lipoprotein-releasing system permease protein